MSSKPYSEKLKDGRWQMLRLRMFEAAKWKCMDCPAEGTLGATLQVHHIYYLLGKEPWEHPDAILRTVCEACHKLRHPVEQKLFLAMAELMNRPLEELKEWPLWILHTEGIDPKGPPAQEDEK